jgi:hypothetical protein
MRATTVKVTLSCSFLAMALFAWTETRRPCLWEMTTTTTWQQLPAPVSDGGDDSPFEGGTKTRLVCLSQAQIEKYGVIAPMTRSGTCQLVDVIKKDDSTTAGMICSGKMSGMGSLESSWEDDQHAKDQVHFVGLIQAGANTRPMEWTSASASTFKGRDCGDMKPFAMPEGR